MICVYHEVDEREAVSSESVKGSEGLYDCSECCDGIFPGDRFLECRCLVSGCGGVSRCCLRCQFDIQRVFSFRHRLEWGWDDRFPAEGDLAAALDGLGWVPTSRGDVPADFHFGWWVPAWAADAKALVSASNFF